MKRLFRLLKRFFTRDYSKPVDTVISHGNGKPKSVVFGVIIPHTKKAQGAETPDNKWSEYIYALEVMKTALFMHFTRDNVGVKGAAKQLKETGCTASIEIHCNAYNNKVGGAEILVMRNDSGSIRYAELILDDFKRKFPNNNIRGVKKISKGDRGYNNLRDAKRGGMSIVLLSELFFIDNKSDWVEPRDMAAFLNGALV